MRYKPYTIVPALIGIEPVMNLIRKHYVALDLFSLRGYGIRGLPAATYGARLGGLVEISSTKRVILFCFGMIEVTQEHDSTSS